MKQKRKVKSLLPQKKDWRSSFLTAVLLILSVALCIGSASLITSRVWAAEFQGFQYTGLDDKQEVLYGMRFVNKNDMQKLVSEIYVKGKSLYIVPNPVVVNEVPGGTEGVFGSTNAVNLGVYGHVLGGRDNKVESENVTLIAGAYNTVPEGNDNAAFLGGDSNKHIEKSGGTPVVVVGGQSNEVGENHDGVALIGGKSNKVGESVSNAFLLGGGDNYVEDNIKNVIVGGQNVEVNSTDNVFVYSNKGSFVPKSSNAFYLNMGKGVGINTDASDKGLAVKGAVSLGAIDIKKEECNSNNLGVEGSYQGCVVGCTDASESERKREMLDRGQKCLDICADLSNANYCIFQKDEEIPPKPDYKAFCTEGVDLSNAELCFPDELSGYQNVIFETSLVDNGDCDMAKGENKCVYQCKSGYHLAKDKTQASNLDGDRGKIKCFKDCDLRTLLGTDWDNYTGTIGTGKLRHNETVIAYNKKEVQLSQDIYVPGIKTSTVGKYDFYYQDDGYGTKLNKNRNRTPIGYDTQQRYDLPEHCANNAHMQKLVCVNGKVYIANPNDTATTVLATKGGNFTEDPLWYQHDGYRYKDCETKQYRCDTGADAYNLTRAQILDPTLLNDRDDGKKRSRRDRDLTYLTRGVYKLCLDYDVVDGQNNTGKVHNSGNPYYDHYKFMGCQDNYHPFTGEDGVVRCMKECTVTALLSNNTEKALTRHHNYAYEFYLSGSETCTGVCKSQWFVCNDGTFYQSGYVGNHSKTREKLNYKYSECGLHDNMCNTDEYNVTASVYEQWKDYGTYISCDDHLNSSPKGRNHSDPTVDTKYNKQCVEDITHYKLVDCNPGYHTEDNERCIPNVWDEPCENKPNNSHWVRETQVLGNYPWSNLITKYLDNKLSAGKYLRRWDESCDWNGPKDSCKTDELQDGNEGEVIPGEACKWECNTGYRNNGGYCQKIDTSCQYPEDNQNACMNTEPYACKDQEHTSIENQKLDSDGVTWRWDCVNGIESDRKSCMLCKDGYHIEGGKCVKNIDGECNNNLAPDSSINYACNHGTPVDKNSTDPEKYTWDCAGTPTNYDAPNVPLRKPGPDCSAAEDDYGCYKCKVGYHKTSTYGECEINECSKQNEPEGEGVIKGEGVPTTHNKGWNHVNSTNLGPCEWTCEKGYVQNGNSCRKVKCTGDGFDTTTATQITTIEGADTDVLHTVYDDEDTARNNYCAWVCKEGYVKDGNSCRPVKCTGDGFSTTRAEQVTFIGNSTVDVEQKLFNDRDAVGNTPCAWACKEGYKLNAAGTACQKISYSCATTLTNKYKCVDGSTYVDGTLANPSHANNEYMWYCNNGATKCGLCDDGTIPGNFHNGACVEETDPNKVGPVAHVKNSISANPMKVVAYINGKEYEASCKVSKGGSDSCYFSGEKLTPGDNYTIIIYPIYEDGSLGAKCNLEPSGVENRIDQRGWMGGSNVGGVRQGYIWNCEDESPRCAFNGSYCSRGTKVEGYLMTYGEHWECKGMGKYSNESKECGLNWNCSGTCSLDGSAGCGEDGAQLYPNNGKGIAGFGEMTCKTAGYMVNYGSNGENNGIEPCRLSDESLQSPYHLVPPCRGTYGGCAKWTANLYCTINDGGISNTYYNDQAISKCGASGISSPSCKSSSAAGPFGGGGSSSDNGCHIKSNSAYPDGCKAAYHGGSMAGETNAVVNNNGVWNISDATNPAGLTSYCKGQTTKPACEAVGVARHQPLSYTVRYWGVTLPYNNTNFNVDTAACCEWN